MPSKCSDGNCERLRLLLHAVLTINERASKSRSERISSRLTRSYQSVGIVGEL